MKIRRSSKNWRNALGLGQIMATLLVVLPTIAFSVTFLIAYWNVMQVDYRLKLIANLAADFSNSRMDLRDFSNGSGSDATDFAAFKVSASRLCPGGRTIGFSDLVNAASANEVFITVTYTTPASDTYLGGTVINTQIQTYSYHDQNMSVVLTCPNS